RPPRRIVVLMRAIVPSSDLACIGGSAPAKAGSLSEPSGGATSALPAPTTPPRGSNKRRGRASWDRMSRRPTCRPRVIGTATATAAATHAHAARKRYTMRTTHKRAVLGLSLALVGSALAACGGSNSSGSAGASTNFVDGKTFTLALASDPGALDPQGSAGSSLIQLS